MKAEVSASCVQTRHAGREYVRPRRTCPGCRLKLRFRRLLEAKRLDWDEGGAAPAAALWLLVAGVRRRSRVVFMIVVMRYRMRRVTSGGWSGHRRVLEKSTLQRRGCDQRDE